jgi:DNA modification methylase
MVKDIVYNIDCFKGFKTIKDKTIDHVFTSPPYNRKRNDKYAFHDDRLVNYYEFLKLTIDECLRVTKGFVFFNIQKNYYNKSEIFKIIGEYSNDIVEIFIWEKTNPLPASGKSITNAYEFFIIFGDKSLKSNTTYTKNILTTSVNTKTDKNHKAIMKQEVSDYFIEKFTNENEVILDCFMGTGTTAISCIKFNRRYIGFELVNEYFKMCENKIQLFVK